MHNIERFFKQIMRLIDIFFFRLISIFLKGVLLPSRTLSTPPSFSSSLKKQTNKRLHSVNTKDFTPGPKNLFLVLLLQQQQQN